MLQNLPNNSNTESIKKAILNTMAFFSIYDLPISLISIHQYLYKTHSFFEAVEIAASQLVNEGKLVTKNQLYALNAWDDTKLEANRMEIAKRWRKVNRYYWLLSLIPFIHHISIINSLAMGNADFESDIDFFVVTKPNRLYFVRTIVIILFRILGVYKTKRHINERFCFGFYVTSNRLSLAKVLLPDDDPHFAFWFGHFAPLLNKDGYKQLILANPWIYTYFPNFDFDLRLTQIKQKNILMRIIKGIFEVTLVLPTMILEPVLRGIHIRHTFNLPENHWPTSTTVANAHMLKLHALDPRIDIRQKFYALLQSL